MRLSCLVLLLAVGMLLPAATRQTPCCPAATIPLPTAVLPWRPLPGDGRTEWTFYRSDMARYRQCVESYLNTARQDVARIHKQMERAVREYNEASGN